MLNSAKAETDTINSHVTSSANMENISENIHANIPENISENILLTSKCILPDNPIEVNGYDFNDGLNWNAFFSSFQTMGFQASLFYEACKTVDEMVSRHFKF